MEKWQLAQRMSLPLAVKRNLSRIRIIQWYERYNGDVYVSFSGGKDSQVLLEEVRSIYPNVPAVFCNTGLEYPEVLEVVRSYENVIWIKPKKSFKQVLDEYGYPITTKEQAHYLKQIRKYPDKPNTKRLLTGITPSGEPTTYVLSKKWYPLMKAPFKVTDECCKVMKKEPFIKYEKETGRKAFIGFVSGESIMRNQNYLKTGCNAFENKRPKSTPLAFWSEQDILTYIVENDIKMATVYGDIKAEVIMKGDHKKVWVKKEVLYTTGLSRTGCMFCGFGVHLEKHPNRFIQMKKSHYKLWEYCMYNLGMSVPLEFIGVEYGQQYTLFDEVKK